MNMNEIQALLAESPIDLDNDICFCENCGEEITILTASRYGDKCQDCYVGIK